MLTVRIERRGSAATHLAKIRRALLGPKDVRIGFLHGHATDKAFWNEFGTTRIPERPFMRITVHKNRRKYAMFARKTAGRIARAEVQLEQELRKLGEVAVGDIKDTIRSSVPPPNAPSTIAAKGSSRTLIDTGDMLQAVTYELD